MNFLTNYLNNKFSRADRCLIQAILAFSIAIAQFAIAFRNDSAALYSDGSHRIVDGLTFLSGFYCARLGQKSSSKKTENVADAIGGLISSGWQLITGILVLLEAISHFIHIKPVDHPMEVLIMGAVAIGADVIGLWLIGHDHPGCGCGHDHGHGHGHGIIPVRKNFLAKQILYRILDYQQSCCSDHDHQHGQGGCCSGHGHSHGTAGGQGPSQKAPVHQHGQGGCCSGHDHNHGTAGGQGPSQKAPVHQHGQGGCCSGHDHSHGTAGGQGPSQKAPVHQHGQGGCCSGHDHSHGTAGGEAPFEETPVHQHGQGGCCSGHDHGHETAAGPSSPAIAPIKHDHVVMPGSFQEDYAFSGDHADVEKGEYERKRSDLHPEEQASWWTYPIRTILSKLIPSDHHDHDQDRQGHRNQDHHEHVHVHVHVHQNQQDHGHQEHDHDHHDHGHGCQCQCNNHHEAEQDVQDERPPVAAVPEQPDDRSEIIVENATHDHRFEVDLEKYEDGCCGHDHSHSHSHSHSHAEPNRNFMSATWNAFLALVGGRKRNDGSLNSHGLHLHIICDLMNNVGVIIAGLVMWLKPDAPGVQYADCIVGLLIGLVMIVTSIPIFKASFNKVFQATFEMTPDLEMAPLDPDFEDERNADVLREYLQRTMRYIVGQARLAELFREPAFLSFRSWRASL